MMMPPPRNCARKSPASPSMARTTPPWPVVATSPSSASCRTSSTSSPSAWNPRRTAPARSVPSKARCRTCSGRSRICATPPSTPRRSPPARLRVTRSRLDRPSPPTTAVLPNPCRANSPTCAPCRAPRTGARIRPLRPCMRRWNGSSPAWPCSKTSSAMCARNPSPPRRRRPRQGTAPRQFPRPSVRQHCLPSATSPRSTT